VRSRLLAVPAAGVAALALSLPSSAARPATVFVHGSPYGSVLFDGRGFALYAFTRDGRGASTCKGACAKAWPPYVVRSRGTAGAGAKDALLGTRRRADGSLQVTYGGRPLYYYKGDRKRYQILCQNVSEFGGLWLVVREDGKLVRE
jgi:predicted lipoprotein with Yx(FWY)xxD motif